MKKNGEVITTHLKSREGWHFYGHGAYSHDGQLLYLTENHYQMKRGVVVVRDAETFKVLDQIETKNPGPHDMGLLKNQNTLVIANGGQVDVPLNGDSVNLTTKGYKSNLSVIDLKSKNEIFSFMADENYSIRHLFIDEKTVAFIGVYKGIEEDKSIRPQYFKEIAFIRFYHIQEKKIVDAQLSKSLAEEMQFHTLSVSVSSKHQVAAVTSPWGNLVTLWNTQTGALLHKVKIHKASGVQVSKDQNHFYISSFVGTFQVLDVSSFQDVYINLEDSLGLKYQWGSHLMVV
jgi:hypothetical protein